MKRNGDRRAKRLIAQLPPQVFRPLFRRRRSSVTGIDREVPERYITTITVAIPVETGVNRFADCLSIVLIVCVYHNNCIPVSVISLCNTSSRDVYHCPSPFFLSCCWILASLAAFPPALLDSARVSCKCCNCLANCSTCFVKAPIPDTPVLSKYQLVSITREIDRGPKIPRLTLETPLSNLETSPSRFVPLAVHHPPYPS